jgi:hypothetical protein
MTRDEAVRHAVKILGTRECQEDVERAIEEIEWRRTLNARRTKKQKAAALRLAQALRRVNVAMKSSDLYPLLRSSYLPDWRLSIWISHCQAIADRPFSRNDGTGIGETEKYIASKAYDLMQRYDRPISTTKRSPFEKLAAALSGDVTADFHHYCRAVVRSAKLGSK